MAVDAQAEGDVFEPGPPRALFKTGVAMPGPSDTPDYIYNLAADGQRFLINEPIRANPSPASAPTGQDAESTTVLNVIVNWNAGLGRK